ncbi:MAG TPA: hypothetical protein VHW43_02795 [Puia sp.]|jgi:hypothetical protein|nr:hypothetical protein [Puia sp.]
MNTGIYLLLLLTLHLTGLIMMAGTTLVDYVVFRTFIKLPTGQKETLQVSAKFSRLIGIGAALLILTGFGMMILTKGVFGQQRWFRIKFGLVILLVANGLFVGRRQGLKFRHLLSENLFAHSPKVLAVIKTLNRFYLAQLIVFLTIIVLSVFKFN